MNIFKTTKIGLSINFLSKNNILKFSLLNFKINTKKKDKNILNIIVNIINVLILLNVTNEHDIIFDENYKINVLKRKRLNFL